MLYDRRKVLVGLFIAVSIYSLIIVSTDRWAQPGHTNRFRNLRSNPGYSVTAVPEAAFDGSTTHETEERAIFPLFNQIISKTSGLSSKFSVLKKNPEVIAALSNPVAKKVGTAIEKNPKILARLSSNPAVLEKMAKNPQVASAVKVLEQKRVSFTAKDVGFLRSIANKDPTKAGLVSELVNFVKRFGLGAN